ncbi:MAG: hypothetical protein ACI8X5_001827, partial [Planctomycetota bacterium]
MTRLRTTTVLFGSAVLLAASVQFAESQSVESLRSLPRSAPPVADGLTLHWGDFDLDGLEDVFAVAGLRVSLLHNDGNGAFSDVTVAKCLDPEVRVRQASWGDSDGDGWIDLLLVMADGSLELLCSDNGGCFISATDASGLGELAMVNSASWLDYDRDGILDMHLKGATGHVLLHGSSGGAYSSAAAGPELSAGLLVTTSGEGALAREGQVQTAPPLGSGSSAAASVSNPVLTGAVGTSAGSFGDPQPVVGCSTGVIDTVTQNCIAAASVGTLGLLYPLSTDFNVDASGDIHFGDGSDRTTVIQEGVSASLVTADGAGNMYIQTGTDLSGGSTARLLFTGMGGGPVNMAIAADGNVGVGVANPAAQLHIKASASETLIRGEVADITVFEVTDTGRVVTTALEITGGGDLVEGFETTGGQAPAGTVMIIDASNSGRLIPSKSAYDTKVAGVVSGAGGVKHGIRMGQDDVLDGETLLAMTGRVYVQCSTENGAIQPGDRLTTSSLAGFAMKATDTTRSVGSVIGKAMSALAG